MYKPKGTPSKIKPRLTLDQYKIVLERKAAGNGRASYKDLTAQWNVGQSTIGSAIKRGIKQYDYLLWKESLREGANQ